MSKIKILLDNSVIKESFFEELDKNNVLDLVNNGLISFYLPDIIFYENFISLRYKDYNKFVKLLNFCFKYCDNVFLPLRTIIEQEINNPNSNNLEYFYNKNKIDEFIKDYKNSNIIWDINKYNRDKISNQITFNLINTYIDEHKSIIDKIKSKSDLEKYITYNIQKYSDFNLDRTLIYKTFEKGKSPKENAKNVFGFISSYFLTNAMISNFNTTYEQLRQLFEKDNYFWGYYNTYFCTLISRVSYENFHKDDTYFDNDYIAYMKDLDIMVTKDSRYMKDCFNKVYENSSKKILEPKNLINSLLKI